LNLAERPRVRLSPGPTPLEECPRLSAALGGPHIWVKRDDLTGVGLGGNKIRKLEYLLGDAVRRGRDTIITTGALQSNHARLTAAACRRLGLEVVLVLAAGEETTAERGLPPACGNLLLDRLFGAEIILTDAGSDEDIAAAMDDAAARLEARGRTPYVIPVGGSNAVGTVGYVAAALEISAQAQAESVHFDHVFVTTGSGGTHAGLLLGAALYLPGTEVHGVTVSREPASSAARVNALIRDTASLLGLAGNPAPPAVVHGGYVGEGYGVPTDAGWEAITLAARTEGLVLDPVYTGKTMSGLVGLIREGTLPTTAKVLYVHTGGAPGFMARSTAFEDYLSRTGEALGQGHPAGERRT